MQIWHDWSITSPQTSVSPPVLRYDVRSATAAGFCIAALFFDAMGWLLGIIGIFLLRRAAFSPGMKWGLAAVALAPKILFLGLRHLSAPAGLSFAIEPWTLATTSSIWAWSVLLAAVGVSIMNLPQKAPSDPNVPTQPDSQGSLLTKLVGAVPIALALAMLLGLIDGFQRIDDAGNGRWALKHAVRGTRATFTRNELAGIDVTQRSGSRSASTYYVDLTLTDGRTFSVSTRSVDALKELRTFATTANLGPGKVRIRPRRGETWINGASGFTLKDCIATYENVDKQNGERSTVEFWLEGERLTGKETVLDGRNKYVRLLRNVKISDTGEVAFEPATIAEVGQPSKATMSFSLRWSPQGETGRFTKDGLEIGLKKFLRL